MVPNNKMDTNMVYFTDSKETPERQQRMGGAVPNRPSRNVWKEAEKGGRSISAARVKKQLGFEQMVDHPSSYKLTDLHRHFLGSAPKVSHGAE